TPADRANVMLYMLANGGGPALPAVEAAPAAEGDAAAVEGEAVEGEAGAEAAPADAAAAEAAPAASAAYAKRYKKGRSLWDAAFFVSGVIACLSGPGLNSWCPARLVAISATGQA